MAISIMAYSWITALITVILIGLWSVATYKKHKTSKKLPPGTNGLPIIGTLHMMSDLPHRDFHRLARKYGPIMHIKIGQISVIVASAPEYAKLFLKTHDAVFASRPNAEAAKIMSYGAKGMSYSKYGPYWRNIRKVCTLELMTSAKIEAFRPMRNEELLSVVESLKVAADRGEAVCLSHKMEKLVEDMTYMMVFGSKDDRFIFKPVITEALKLAGSFVIGDYIPFLKGLDLQGIIPRMKVVNKVYDELMEKIIEEHIQKAKNDQQEGHFKDFIDVMLSLIGSNYVQEVQIDRDNIKALIFDLLVAGMETSVDATNWALSELLRHPKVMKKVQEELQNVVGMDRMVEETDLGKLNYLNMVVKETLRLHPVVPLLLPHKGTQDMTIGDYYISEETWVIINVFAIGRDPNVWKNSEEFNPDRFIDTDIDVHGRNFELLPFGSGRRGCPGVQLGLKLVQLLVAQMVHCFNWELPNGMSPSELDMSEKYGLALSRASPLVCIPTFRLHVDHL